MKTISVLAVSLLFSTPIFATTQHFIYSSENGAVKLFVTQKSSGRAYISKVSIENNKCTITENGGFLRGRLHTEFSVNWATFGWKTPKNKTINGVMENSATKSYASTSVTWDALSRLGCQIKAGTAKLPNIKQN